MKTAKRFWTNGLVTSAILLSLAWGRSPFADERQPDERVVFAEKLVSEGRLNEAVEQFLSYYADNQNNHRVLERIGYLYERASRFDEAVEFGERYLLSSGDVVQGRIDRLVELAEKAWGAEARARYISMAENSGHKGILSKMVLAAFANRTNEKSALRAYYLDTLQKVSPPADWWDKTVNRFLLDRFIHERWLDEAVEAYRNCRDCKRLIELGQWLRREGRGFEMLELYQQYLLSDVNECGDETHHWFSYGRFGHKTLATEVINQLCSLGRGKALLVKLAGVVEDEGGNAVVHRNLGYLLFKMKRYEESLVEFENYLARLQRPLATDYEWVGRLCANMGLVEQAVAFYEAAVETGPTPEELHRESMTSQMWMPLQRWKALFEARILKELGSLYVKQERWAEAEKCFKRIAESDSGRYKDEAKAELAKMWERSGKQNVFLRQLNAELEKDPCSVKLRVEYAHNLAKAAKTEEAIKQLEEAVRMSPEDLSVCLKLAETLAEAKRSDEVIEQYLKLLRIGMRRDSESFRRGKGGDPTEPASVLSRLVWFCKRNGKKDKLLEIYDEVLLVLEEPETKWEPQEYMLERIVRDMVELLEGEADYEGIVELCLSRRGQTGYHSRDAIERAARHLDSATELISVLEEETKADANDWWGRFTLGDMLRLENRVGEAVKVYTSLLADVPVGHRISHDLGQLFELRLNRYDLAAKAYERSLERVKPGTKDYANRLGMIARVYLKLGRKEKAAERYREAIEYDPSEFEYRLGLQRALGYETEEAAVHKLPEQIRDLATMRKEAHSLLYRSKDFEKAAAVYEEIVEKAPTDVDSMVGLGKAYEQLGNIEESVSWYRKAFGMRAWSYGNDRGASSGLERVYRRTGQDVKLVELYILRRDYSALKSYWQSRKELEKFHEFLRDEYEKNPADVQVRFFLAEGYWERGEKTLSEQILEQLRSDFAENKDLVQNKYQFLRLARGFEKLEQYDDALEIMSVFDYEKDPDRNDWVGEPLMRFYGQSGRFKEALRVCGLRLMKDSGGHHTVKIAGQIAELSQRCADGRQLLETFVTDMEGDIRQRNWERFAGAVKSYLASHPPKGANGDAGVANPVKVIQQGKQVKVLKNCRSFADFLEKLAFEAGTVATQSFLGEYGRRRKPPSVEMDNGSVLEVLAAALDGTNIPMELTQDGHWAFYESGDKNRKLSYAGKGGALCKFEGLNRRAEREHIWAQGRMIFEPGLKWHVVSIQSLFEVLEAIDDRGRKVPIPGVRPRWYPSTQIEIQLGKQEPPAEKISKLVTRTVVAVGTKWVEFEVKRLDHTKPVVFESDGVKVQVGPVEEKDRRIPVQITKTGMRTRALSSEKMSLRGEYRLIGSDGSEISFGRSGSSCLSGEAKIGLHITMSKFDPASTSLYIREPIEIEPVPLEFTFRDIPIVDR
jgi:tetratricopeptide (TPR) repeat protein